MYRYIHITMYYILCTLIYVTLQLYLYIYIKVIYKRKKCRKNGRLVANSRFTLFL